MADVFISYSRPDRPRIERLAAALETEGFDVWWDRRLEGGVEFSKETEAQLASARVVLVAWSNLSVNSNWVADEATHGRDKSALVPIAIDAVEPKIGFRQYQTINFADWRGARSAPAFRDLVAALRARMSESGAPANNVRAAPARPQAGAVMPGLSPAVLMAGIVALGIVAVIALGLIFRNAPETPPGSAQDEPAEFAQATDAGPAAESAIAADAKSIAVLPFTALSQDESDEYFGKGLAEELLNVLASHPDLKVAARTSAFSFEDKNVDVREIGEQLGVAHVLEGSVRRSGERLRVTAQLVRAADGFHLWSNTYERELADIFALEDAIVRDIARTLEVRLGVGGGAGRAGREGVDPRAYEAYLRGMTSWGERDRAGANRPDALKAFQNAAAFDPAFADAWAAIGVSGAYSFPFQFGVTRDELSALTEEGFQKALALDPDNAIAHAGLVMWSLGKPDIAAAKAHLERALTLTPNRADAHYVAAHYWMMIGDPERATAAFERALALDPLNMMMRRSYASFLAGIGRFEEAFAFNDKCYETRCLAEGFPAHAMFQAIYSGDRARIRKWLPVYEELENLVRNLPPSRMPTPMFAMPAAVSVAAGRSDREDRLAEARAYLSDNVVREEIGMWGPILAKALPAEIILDSIESAVDHRSFVGSAQNVAPLYSVNPWPEEILRHPRYRALWERPGMPELAAARRANGWDDGLPLPADD